MIVAIKECSSCGKDHPRVRLVKLPKEKFFRDNVYTHYGTCPENGRIVYCCAVKEKIEDTTFII